MKQNCSGGHSQTWRCHESAPKTCRTCEKAQKEAEKKAQKDLEAKLKQDEMNQKHLKDLAKITEEIEKYNQNMKEAKLQEEQRAILAQKKKDLAAIKERASKQASSNQDPDDSEGKVKQFYDAQDNVAPAPQPQSRPKEPPKSTINGRAKLRDQINSAISHNKSPSKTEWQRQKDQENENNPAIDAIMEMIGLEDVKSQVLRIKAKVDTSKRQSTDLKKERLGLTLLGNPGTGVFLPYYKKSNFTRDGRTELVGVVGSLPKEVSAATFGVPVSFISRIVMSILMLAAILKHR